MNDLPPEFDAIFGTLKKPPKELTPEQEAGKALLDLAAKFKSLNEKKL